MVPGYAEPYIENIEPVVNVLYIFEKVGGGGKKKKRWEKKKSRRILLWALFYDGLA